MCNNEYMGTVRVLGTSCDIDVCGACGKPELKKTVVIEVDGEIGYYGCDCAARIIGWGVKDIRAKAKDADDAERDRIKVAIQSHPLKDVPNWRFWSEVVVPPSVESLNEAEALR